MEQIIEQVRQITPELIDQTIEYYTSILQFWAIACTGLFMGSMVVGIIGIKKQWCGDGFIGFFVMFLGGLFSFIGMAVSFEGLYKLNTAPYLFVLDSLVK